MSSSKKPKSVFSARLTEHQWDSIENLMESLLPLMKEPQKLNNASLMGGLIGLASKVTAEDLLGEIRENII